MFAFVHVDFQSAGLHPLHFGIYIWPLNNKAVQGCDLLNQRSIFNVQASDACLLQEHGRGGRGGRRGGGTFVSK